MDADTPFALFGDRGTTLLSVLVFLSCGTLAFAVMLGVRARQAVRRRAATVRPDHDRAGGDNDAPHTRFAVARKLVDYTTKHYASDGKDTKVLRNRMLQAGIYEPHAVAYFFIARTGMALGIAVILIFVLPLLGMAGKSSFWLCVMLGGLLGYLAPGYYLDRRIAARRVEHRSGFPDFMDLLVICADAGLAMEAALDRVRAELASAYPSLSANIHIANLEIRAGRTLPEALEHFGERVGIEEARSFATLLQQSGELGTSISSALRV